MNNNDVRCFTTQALKGMLFMVLGIIILFQTLGLFQRWLPFLITIGSVALIVYGAILAGFHHEIMKLFKRNK